MVDFAKITQGLLFLSMVHTVAVISYYCWSFVFMLQGRMSSFGLPDSLKGPELVAVNHPVGLYVQGPDLAGVPDYVRPVYEHIVDRTPGTFIELGGELVEELLAERPDNFGWFDRRPRLLAGLVSFTAFVAMVLINWFLVRASECRMRKFIGECMFQGEAVLDMNQTAILGQAVPNFQCGVYVGDFQIANACRMDSYLLVNEHTMRNRSVVASEGNITIRNKARDGSIKSLELNGSRFQEAGFDTLFVELTAKEWSTIGLRLPSVSFVGKALTCMITACGKTYSGVVKAASRDSTLFTTTANTEPGFSGAAHVHNNQFVGFHCGIFAATIKGNDHKANGGVYAWALLANIRAKLGKDVEEEEARLENVRMETGESWTDEQHEEQEINTPSGTYRADRRGRVVKKKTNWTGLGDLLNKNQDYDDRFEEAYDKEADLAVDRLVAKMEGLGFDYDRSKLKTNWKANKANRQGIAEKFQGEAKAKEEATLAEAEPKTRHVRRDENISTIVRSYTTRIESVEEKMNSIHATLVQLVEGESRIPRKQRKTKIRWNPSKGEDVSGGNFKDGNPDESDSYSEYSSTDSGNEQRPAKAGPSRSVSGAANGNSSTSGKKKGSQSQTNSQNSTKKSRKASRKKKNGSQQATATRPEAAQPSTPQ